VFYKSTLGGAWVRMGPFGDLAVEGELDGDGIKDLLWSKIGDGVWVKYSSTAKWERLCVAPAIDIDAGLMRGGFNPWPSAAIEGFMKLLAPRGGYAEGPGSITEYEDLSDWGPGGSRFVFIEEDNLFPQETNSMTIMRIPGPDDPGFTYVEQKNPLPINGKKKRDMK
jgi:hypothetical protein